MEELIFDLLYADKIKEALNDNCRIEINHIDGKTESSIEGRGITLLVVFAAIEKQLLKKVGCSEKEFKMLKKKIGTREE